jgi:HTH-type transcriptional regulator/antitoxin HigA
MSTHGQGGRWAPDYAVSPGDVLAEQIEARGWSQADLARRLNRSPKMVSEMISGKNPVEPDTALALERVLGVRAEIWTNLEAIWRTFQAREADRRRAEERNAWVKEFPLLALRRVGVLPGAQDPASRDVAGMRERLLSFFAVASEEAYEKRWDSLRVAYRHSKAHESSRNALRTWLRLGERVAENVSAPPFDEAKARALVPRLRELSLGEPDDYIGVVTSLCLSAGVVVVVVPRLEKACLSGAAYRLPGGPGVVQLSLRHKTNDHYWFSFFHELGHLVLHKRVAFFVDDSASDLSGGDEEREADEWAEDSLVGRAHFTEFCRGQPRSGAEVTAFAKSVGVHPGIVVGMLQHRGIIPWRNLNGLKQTLDVEACAAAALHSIQPASAAAE